MSVICTKGLSITVKPRVPRCKCLDAPTGQYPRIKGWVHGLIGSGCPQTPHVGSTAWDGFFVDPIFDWCSYLTSQPSFWTTCSPNVAMAGDLIDMGSSGGPDTYWLLEIYMWDPPWGFIWTGKSAFGTGGGSCSTPIGIIFTKTSGCSTGPATLELEGATYPP